MSTTLLPARFSPEQVVGNEPLIPCRHTSHIIHATGCILQNRFTRRPKIGSIPGGFQFSGLEYGPHPAVFPAELASGSRGFTC